MMMTDDFYQLFQRCVTQTRSGVSVEQCLAQHPRYAEELRPLLMAATSSPDRAGEGMSLAAKHWVRNRVMAYWDMKHSRKGSWWFPSFSPVRWAGAAAIAVAIVLVIGGAGTAAAAQGSVPGSALYSVKQLREDVRLWFATSSEEKVNVASGHVQERVREVLELAQPGDSVAISASLSRLEQHLSDVDQLTAESTKAPALESGRHSIIETLDRSLVAFGQYISVLAAYPCLHHTLEVLQKARDRDSATVERVGGSLSGGDGRQIAPLDTFCPP